MLVVLIIIRPDCQGYVCPGMLVVLTTEPGVRVIQEAWYRHTLISPPGYHILRLGISAGCSVTPFHQVSSTIVGGREILNPLENGNYYYYYYYYYSLKNCLRISICMYKGKFWNS